MYGTGKKKKKKVKLSQILKVIATAFKIGAQGASIAGELSPDHKAKLDKYGDQFNRYGNAAEKTGALVGQFGGGPDTRTKSALTKLNNFIAGKTKIKPEDLLITGGILAAGVGTVLDASGVGTPLGIPLQAAGAELIATGGSGKAARMGKVTPLQKGMGTATDTRPIPGGPVAKQMVGQSGTGRYKKRGRNMKGGAIDFGGLAKVGNWKKQIRTEYKACKKRLRTQSGFRRKGARDKCRTEFKNKLKQFKTYTGLERPVNVTIGGYAGTTTSSGQASTVPISEGSKLAERLNPATAGSAQSGGCAKCPGKKRNGVGSKAEVWSGKARRTSGGLMKSDLMKNKRGKIISKKMHAKGKALYASLR